MSSSGHIRKVHRILEATSGYSMDVRVSLVKEHIGKEISDVCCSEVKSVFTALKDKHESFLSARTDAVESDSPYFIGLTATLEILKHYKVQ